MTKKIISILFIFLMCLTITGCQSKEEKEKIDEIISELKLEIPTNLHLLNKEEYQIVEIEQCKKKETPILEDEYDKYGINENTYFFKFKIKTENNEESDLYVLYYSDRSYLKEYKYYTDITSHDELKKFILLSKTGSSEPVFFRSHLHSHWYDYNLDGKDFIYRCTSCHVIEQLYDIKSESFITHEASEEERQERIEEEKEKDLKAIELIAYNQIKIKGASSYEITKVVSNGSFYSIHIKASSGLTGTIKVQREQGHLVIYYGNARFTSGNVIYDLTNNSVE